MTESDAIEAIEARWVSLWPSLHPEIPFTLESEKFTGVDVWARVSVTHTVSLQQSQGGPGTRRWVRNGNIWVQLFGNVDAGRRPLSLLVADVRTIFEGVSLPALSGGEPVSCLALSTRESPTDNRWYMLTMLTAFYYFETR